MDVLISGASTGIGHAVAIQLARKGHRVWAGVRAQSAFDDLTNQNITGLNPIFLDVTNSSAIVEAVDLVKKKSGQLHALINNAGVAYGGPTEVISLKNWRSQFDVNFFGLIELTKMSLPMLRASKGRIINISSIAGRIAQPYMAPYCASKFAVEAYSDSLRRELRRTGVRVSLVEPGAINTPIWQKGLSQNKMMVGELTSDLEQVYGPSLVKFIKVVESAERNAEPVSLVITAVEHALTSRSPKVRYPVGRGIALLSWISGTLPSRWMDGLLSFLH